MKNLPSKRGSRLMRARLSASGSRPEMVSMERTISARRVESSHFRTWRRKRRPPRARAACSSSAASRRHGPRKRRPRHTRVT